MNQTRFRDVDESAQQKKNENRPNNNKQNRFIVVHLDTNKNKQGSCFTVVTEQPPNPIDETGSMLMQQLHREPTRTQAHVHSPETHGDTTVDQQQQARVHSKCFKQTTINRRHSCEMNTHVHTKTHKHTHTQRQKGASRGKQIDFSLDTIRHK